MFLIRSQYVLVIGVWFALLLSGCSVNPVTGKKQLLIISETKEFQIGREQYSYAQQSQGGEYYLDPELTFYVRNVGQKLAKVSDRPDLPYEFVVLNNSVPNAWALPSGKIAINRGLLVQLKDEAQLAAVMGHEIVHAAARHSAQRMQQGLITDVAIAGLDIALDGKEYNELILGVAALGADLTIAKYSRKHELESDHYGMKYMSLLGYDLQAAVELQELFVKLSQEKQASWINGLFASHPPSMERVKKNRITIGQYPQGSYRGKQEFNAAMSYLRSKMPAYQAQDKATKLLAEKNYSQALSQVNKAIKIEPNEAIFYAFRGDIFDKQGKNNSALEDYNKAVSLYPEIFSNYLKRGEANQKAGNYRQAQADFEKSNVLLPTSLATLRLGELALAAGNKQLAATHFANAAQSDDQHGLAARKQLAIIELPTNPERYTNVSHVINDTGDIMVVINNKSPVAIEVSKVQTTIFNAAGQVVKRKVWQTKQRIAGGQKSGYITDPAADSLPQGFQLESEVIEASVAK